MDDFHCNTFEMTVRFKPHEMDVDAFLKALSEKGIDIKPDLDGDTKVGLVFSGSTDTYHAHLEVSLWKSGRGRAELSYHAGGTEKGAHHLASADDCTQWFGKFFRDTVMKAHGHVYYTFDKSYTTTVALPFPLITNEKTLAGAMVSGLALKLPDQTNTAILQRIEEKIFIFLRGAFQVDLAKFDLISEIERLSSTVGSLVKKVDQTK